MALIAMAKSGKTFEPIPEDQHLARCVLVADIGTHDGKYGLQRQCIIGWELPEVRRTFDADKGEEPAMISRFLTLSLSEKASLRELLEQWRGRAFTPDELAGFDVLQVLGVPCLLQITHTTANDQVRAKVATVSKLHKSITCPAQEIPSRKFALTDGTVDELEALPEWIQQKIQASVEYDEWLTSALNRRGSTSNQAEPVQQTVLEVERGPDGEQPF